MSADKEAVKQLLDRVREAGEAFLADEPGAKARLCNDTSILLRTAEGPATYVPRIRLTALNNLCQLMALEMGLIAAIVKRGSEPVHTRVLAAGLGQDERLISRILRLLSSNGICQQTAPYEYCSNANSAFLDLPSQYGATRNMVELLYPVGGQLVKLVRDLRNAPPERAAELRSPFKYTYGKSMFEYFETDQEHRRAFDAWMAGRRRGRAWFDVYPLQERLTTLSSETNGNTASATIVDVAGGSGHDISALAQRHPELRARLVLQDTSSALALIDKTRIGDAVELMPHDLFEPQPVRGASVYYLRAVLHDWLDDECAAILAHTAAAMVPDQSRLIIEELVLPDTGASAWDAAVDLTMYMMPGGVERTQGEWTVLLTRAGLRVVKIWRDELSGEPIIEAELA